MVFVSLFVAHTYSTSRHRYIKKGDIKFDSREQSRLISRTI